MIVKKYSPIRVHNPSSHQHVVRVNPGQHISLSLFGNPNVQISSEYMRIESCESTDDRRIYVISHKSDVYDWSQYSQVVLGEIWIDYNKSISKLSVVMECNNSSKANFVTLINPDGFDVRLKPHNIIEVVLYDLSFSFQDDWHCDWTSKISGLGIEQIGSDHLCLQSWNSYWDHGLDEASYPYAKYPRVDIPKNNWARQHHFWFRFDLSLNFVIQELKGSIEHAGKLTFFGKSNRHDVSSSTQIRSMDIFLDCRVLKPHFFVDAVTLKTKDECSPFTFTSLKLNEKKKKKENTRPVVRDVDVLVVNQSFEGCRVVEAVEPPSRQKFEEDDPYGFDVDFFPARNRGQIPIIRYV